jgi:predicted alpha/beta superfamily hydrolase
MLNLKKSFTYLIFAALTCILQCQSALARDIVIGQKYAIDSKALAEKREYWISLPSSYDVKDDKKYPVLYLIDANLNSVFHAFSGVVKQMSEDASPLIPEMIVVGIVSQNRMRDSSPTQSLIGLDGKPNQGFKETGGGDKFLEFVQNELAPKIEQDYKTANFRVFSGYSFTGLAVLNALYKTPDFFNAYLAIDPSLWFDDHEMLKRLDQLAEKSLNNRHLYLATSYRTEAIYPKTNYSIKFMNRLKTDPIKGLTTHFDIFGHDVNHHSMQVIGFYNGLKSLFEGYMVEIEARYQPADVLKRQFQLFSKKMGVEFKPREGMLGFFGYSRLQNDTFGMKDTDAAIKFFKLTTQYYPTSSNAWDSLGEGLRVNGELKASLDAFKRSLKLDSSNDNAEKNIKEIQQLLGK